MPNKGLFEWGAGRALLVMAILTVALAPVPACALDVLFVSPRGEPYESLYTAFSTHLRAAHLKVGRTTPDAVGRARDHEPPDLIVVAGIEALQIVMDIPSNPTPVLSLLLTRETFLSLVRSPEQAHISALWLDQPVSEKIRLIHSHLSGIRRIGLLRSGQSTRQFDTAAHETAHELGIDLVEQVTEGGRALIDDLTSLADRVDAILAIPDTGIYGRDTISRVMLTAYRHRTPIIGYSESLTKAGAVMSISSSPEVIGREAADAALMIIRDGMPLPMRRHIMNVDISFNRQVARSLGIGIRE